jgi:hypothetical protein
MTDQTIECRSCGLAFTFNVAEQEFFAARQLSPPKKCKPCRAAARAMREQNDAQQCHRGFAPGVGE